MASESTSLSIVEAHVVLDALIRRLDSDELDESFMGKCWAPVPYFGNLANSRVATVGINPSNKEFEDDIGSELDGRNRRFHTLKSLGIASWSEANNCHIQQILESCTKYFESDRNPYHRWFKPLDKIVAGTGASFYCSDACHLDLVPYATTEKWSSLKKWQKSKLLFMNRDVVGQLLTVSPIDVLILNGKEAVKGFHRAASMWLEYKRMGDWTLQQRSREIDGFAYRGIIDSFPGIKLSHRVRILGYNHNIPGTPCPTKVVESIRDWIAQELSVGLN